MLGLKIIVPSFFGIATCGIFGFIYKNELTSIFEDIDTSENHFRYFVASVSEKQILKASKSDLIVENKINYQCKANGKILSFCELYKLNSEESENNKGLNVDLFSFISEEEEMLLKKKSELISHQKYLVKVHKYDHQKISEDISVVDENDKKFSDLKKLFDIQKDSDFKSNLLLVKAEGNIAASTSDGRKSNLYSCGFGKKSLLGRACEVYEFETEPTIDNNGSITNIDFKKLKKVTKTSPTSSAKYFVLKMNQKSYSKQWRYIEDINVFAGTTTLFNSKYVRTLTGKINTHKPENSNLLIIKPSPVPYFIVASGALPSGITQNKNALLAESNKWETRNYKCRYKEGENNYIVDDKCKIYKFVESGKKATWSKSNINNLAANISDLSTANTYLKIEILNPQFDEIVFFEGSNTIDIVNKTAIANEYFAKTQPLLKAVGKNLSGYATRVLGKLKSSNNTQSPEINNETVFKCKLENMSADYEPCNIYKWTTQGATADFSTIDFTGIKEIEANSDFTSKDNSNFMIDLKGEAHNIHALSISNTTLKVKIEGSGTSEDFIQFINIVPLLNVPEEIKDPIQPFIFK